ncbi:MAG: hypothetical protein DLM67_17655 [Candidatus Nephthysia bennettiae]|nr:MAG: hypothetical protein DLM67_17655 [Candidatus Dormibacteraeota bacterium]
MVDNFVDHQPTVTIALSNPLFGAVTQPIRQAKSGTLDYKGDWTVSATSSNGFITEFEYQS